MSEDDKTRAAAQGIKFSEFKQVTNQEGNPVQVVGLRDGENIRAVLTTDLVATEPEVVFRNSKGQFAAVDPGLLLLDNQLKVNRYFYNWMLEQGVTIDPAPPVTPADGALWFCNLESSMQLFVFHEESDAWIPVAPPATIADRVAAGEDIQSGLVEAVTELETKVTALEGAVGEHSLIFNPNNSNPRAGEFVTKDGTNQVVNTLSAASIIHIAPEDRNGGSIAVDRITAGDVMRLSDISGVTAEVKIKNNLGGGAYEMEKLFGDLDRLSEYPYDFNLFSSFDPAGLATTDYVDARVNTKIGRNAIWTLGDSQPWELRQNDTSGSEKKFIKIHDGKMNLENVATPGVAAQAANKAYVDQAIAAAIANIKLPSTKPQPAQLSWLYSSMTTGAPSTGAFMSTGSNWRFSLKTWCGGDGFWITETAERSWNTSHLCEMSIWMKDGMQWKMVKHVEIEKVYWPAKTSGKSYLSFQQKWQSNETTLKTNTEYFVTVGGFF